MPFVALLPMRKSDNPKHGPRTAAFASCFDGTCHGRLTVNVPGKKASVYAVTRVPCDLAGQGYRCVKVAGGTDAEADSYDVFLGDRPADDTCECRGFLRWGHCRHIDGLRAVIDLGALYLPGFDGPDADAELCDPDADHACTECDDWACEIESQYEDMYGDLIATPVGNGGYYSADPLHDFI